MKIIYFLILILTACSHQELVQQAHVSGNCSDKIKDITPPEGQQLIDLSKQVTFGTASIAIAGIGAATDTLVIVLSHPVTKFTLCVATIAVAAKGRTDPSICNHVTSPHYNPKLTQKALNGTRSWRCSNLDYVSEGLRNVAGCYSEKKEKAKARQQLESILNTKAIVRCLSDDEVNRVQADLKEYLL